MLKARKVVKRREIQEDPVSLYYKKINRFFSEHSKYIQIVAAAVVLILVVTVLMARSKRQAQVTAASQLGIAETYFVQGQIPNAIADFESIANSFPGTKAAGTAVYYLGRIANIQKDFVKAEEYFRKYLKEYKNDPLYKASSMAGIAVCFENKQQYLEAAGWYADAWKTDKTASSAAFFLDNAAMNYRLAGDTAKSRETYQAIIDEYPESSLANRAAYLIEML